MSHLYINNYKNINNYDINKDNNQSNSFANSRSNIIKNKNYFRNNNNKIVYNNKDIINYDEVDKNNLNNNNFNDYERQQNIFEKHFNLSNKVIDDFKKIMEKTEILKSKISQKSKDISNNIFNRTYFFDYENNSKIKNQNEKLDLMDNDEISNIELDNFMTDDNTNYHSNKYRRNNIYDKNEILIEKYKKKNQALTDMNSKLLLKNNNLELEISRYKSDKNNNMTLLAQNTTDIFYNSLHKFITKIKNSLKNNIDSNQSLTHKVLEELNNYYMINDINIEQKNIYGNLRKKFDKKKERIINIQKYNSENYKRYNYLIQEKMMLNKTIKNLKFDLFHLKEIQKKLSSKKSNNLKGNHDQIIYMQNNINKLKNENSNYNSHYTKNKNELTKIQNSINLLDSKKKQLYSKMDDINKEKIRIDEENIKMKKDIEEEGGLVGENRKIVRENELKVELNELKLAKYNLEKKKEENDELIKKMKDIIKLFTTDINNDETEYKDLKKQIAILIKPEKNEIQNKSQLKENKLNDEINEKLDINIKLNDEIKSTMEYYDEIINKKDKEILELEKEANKEKKVLQNPHIKNDQLILETIDENLDSNINEKLNSENNQFNNNDENQKISDYNGDNDSEEKEVNLDEYFENENINEYDENNEEKEYDMNERENLNNYEDNESS